MPSRKRNKGKERRAKKEARSGEWWRHWTIGDRAESDVGCNHGCVVPSRDHTVSRFMNTLDEELTRYRNDILTAMRNTFSKHSEVWNNAELRHMTSSVLLCIGTNLMLQKNPANGDKPIRWGVTIAQAILLLECYGDRGNFEDAYNLADMKVHRSLPGHYGERDVLKFYSKRLACSCLNEKYKLARRTLPKLGRCEHCDTFMQREHLMTCGRCKVPRYCSRECQVAEWPDHDEVCGIYVNCQREM